jgi:hypothetical protein
VTRRLLAALVLLAALAGLRPAFAAPTAGFTARTACCCPEDADEPAAEDRLERRCPCDVRPAPAAPPVPPAAPAPRDPPVALAPTLAPLAPARVRRAAPPAPTRPRARPAPSPPTRVALHIVDLR